MTITTMQLSRIRTDGGTQFRVALDKTTVEQYAEAIKDGAQFPPAIVFVDTDGVAWLADGFHRYAAYKLAGCEDMPVSIEEGSQRQAMIFSLGANADHGLRRSNDDKLKAVMFALRDPELSKLSQRKIAKTCGVTQAMVSKVKARITPAKTDNGYHSTNDPAEVLVALDQKQRLIVLQACGYGGYMPYDATRRLFEQLGMSFEYSDRYEWTPLAHQVVTLILESDPWLKLEKEIHDRHKKKVRGNVGVLKRTIEAVAAYRGGWMGVDEFPYNDRDWLPVIVTEAYLLYTKLELGRKSWDHEEYLCIAPAGLSLLGLPIFDPPPAPTIEGRLAEIEANNKKQLARQEKANEDWKAKDSARRLARPLDSQLESIAHAVGRLEDEIKHAAYLEPVRDELVAALRELEQRMLAVVPEGALDEDDDAEFDDEELDEMDEEDGFNEDDDDG
ncbi:MAG: ParB N-terminal domain-containing protein [bacterium]|nr:ParB N-terminal domain-containing protein [bacterium]